MGKINAERIVEKAQKSSGLTTFDSQSFREGLEVLVGDINRANWPDPGVDWFESMAVRGLSNRLKIDDYIRRHPQVLEQPIKAPIFILGMPRTGTTMLSNLLAVDPTKRSLLAWMADEPVPPAPFKEVLTDPRLMTALELEQKRRAENPRAGRFYMSSAAFPTECIHIHSGDFKSMFWEAMGKLPNYSEWMWSADMTAAYAYERRFLQVLQFDGAASWNLKMPSHALHLKYLLKEFPDARLIWTHRDPYTAVGSLCSLINNTQQKTKVEIDWIADLYPRQAAEHVNRLRAVRAEIGHDRIYDLYYAESMRDPMAAMRKLYAWLGDELTPEAEANMARWLGENPQGKWGKHAYKLDQFGLSEDKLAPLFADYLADYPVEREG
ncbi:sulfotransferase [Phenylobacterium sp. LjRoot219]|uniref:sulfotransferase family protein n=1 Tax=Phenylobacterium sp. LjRoot219 TaxID=3342283 RepID=UPI003ECCA8A7